MTARRVLLQLLLARHLVTEQELGDLVALVNSSFPNSYGSVSEAVASMNAVLEPLGLMLISCQRISDSQVFWGLANNNVGPMSQFSVLHAEAENALVQQIVMALAERSLTENELRDLPGVAARTRKAFESVLASLFEGGWVERVDEAVALGARAFIEFRAQLGGRSAAFR